jgi:hypothetical protein
MKKSSLSLDIETLVELTPEDQSQVNGGAVAPTSTANPGHWTSVSSPMPTPPVHKHKHHKPIVTSSVHKIP